jgi:hypothetical protein
VGRVIARALLLASLGGACCAAGCSASSRGPSSPHAGTAIDAIVGQLRGWHAAADEGDFDAYFSRMTPDSAFLGTDRTEWWTRAEFEAFSRPYFDGEHAWTYVPLETDVAIPGPASGFSPPRVAWVDQVLWNEKYGYCRGTGMLTRVDDGPWLIHRYSLSFLIPNEDAAAVMETIGPQPHPLDAD